MFFMSSFRDLTDDFAVSPQVSLADLEQAKAEGFAAVICNRPDGEDFGQLSAEVIAEKCRTLGLTFTHIPVSGGVNHEQIEVMADALNATTGAVLAYCRSGTRSTNLWAMAQAREGGDAQGLIEAAAGAGYDLSGLSQTLRALAGKD
jgi:uncharacterized protein (TIGR01244 family)